MVTLGPILRDPQLLQPPLFCASSHGISHGAVCLVALCLAPLAPRRLVWASTRGAAGGAAGVEPKATRMGREGHGRPVHSTHETYGNHGDSYDFYGEFMGFYWDFIGISPGISMMIEFIEQMSVLWVN